MIIFVMPTKCVIRVKFLALLTLIMIAPIQSHADDTDDAFKVCSAMERTEMTTGCEVMAA